MNFNLSLKMKFLKYNIFTILGILFFSQYSFSQYAPNEILIDIQKLKVCSSVLYVAAHPDDENTVMLSWLAKGKLVNTAYLSITRGDGGQNLIGAEQSELLGLIRTNELLAARALDGPKQFFTSANDFGFSKTTEETLEYWGEKSILGEVVYRIRAFKPDVIICRFPPDSRAGHGNHSASAVLAEKAFTLSNDPKAYPEQLSKVALWQAKRIVWNTFNFSSQSQIPTEKEYIKVELGDFNPLLGKSYTEIASESRSQHRSQGFGVPKNRGTRPEYLVHKNGEKAKNDVFEGIDVTWSRVEGANGMNEAIDHIIAQYDIQNPKNSVQSLVNLYQKINALPNSYYKNIKLEECKTLIVKCAGLWFEINTSDFSYTSGDIAIFNFSAINRTNVPVKLIEIKQNILAIDSAFNGFNLAGNILKKLEFKRLIDSKTPLTEPFWLAMPKKAIGQYQENGLAENGQAKSNDAFYFDVVLEIFGQKIPFNIPATYKYTNEIRGELYKNVEIRPLANVKFEDKVLYIPSNTSKNIKVVVQANQKIENGILSIKQPTGMVVNPKTIEVGSIEKFENKVFEFNVKINSLVNTSEIGLQLETKGQVFDKEIINIDYDHIQPQVLYIKAIAKVIQEKIKINVAKIGFIDGAGDAAPAILKTLGANVVMIDENDIKGNLNNYETIVVGVRAYNVHKWLPNYQNSLIEYVKNGGNLVVQYQVNSNLQKIVSGIGPYPLKISRERVTLENAVIKSLKPGHSLLNIPNKIVEADFENWVQERGLYFANEWDNKYETIFSMADPNEKAQDGSLLYAKYGKGSFVYTGLSFFRQSPAGVSGAIKLFANLVSKSK